MKTAVNPFYAAQAKPTPRPFSRPTEPVYAKLPAAPVSTSPVPHLTSLYHFDEPGDFGDRRYPGNCGGGLIRDLLHYFQPGTVLDPMSGSGTCLDVCNKLVIPCHSSDLKRGIDAADAANFEGPGLYDFCWLHPPYWRIKVYSSDPRDLSAAPTLEAFLAGYRKVILNCKKALKPGGKLVILMGDVFDLQQGFVSLIYHTKRLCFDAGMPQHCTDIIRFSHGMSSARKTYARPIIPMLHDVCMVFDR